MVKEEVLSFRAFFTPLSLKHCSYVRVCLIDGAAWIFYSNLLPLPLLITCSQGYSKPLGERVRERDGVLSMGLPKRLGALIIFSEQKKT